jgi:hypothetical protein
MRILSACVVFLMLATAAPQDSLDLRARYGAPDVERFTVLTDVMVIVGYGPDGKADSLLIEPRQPFLHDFVRLTPIMEQEPGFEALHDLVPLTRGREFRVVAVTVAGCGAIEFAQYDDVIVGQSYDTCREAVENLGIRSNTLHYTSAELHGRYGQPDAERFRVRPNFTLTAEYGPDRQACAMRIQPLHELGRGESPNDLAVPGEKLNDVLDEVVPPQMRGKELGPGQKIENACAGTALPIEYENVRVYPYYAFCTNPPKVRGTDVRFKRPACATPSTVNVR